MRTVKHEELTEIIRKHDLWVRGEVAGERANLSYSDLSYSDLSGSNLRGSNLSGSNLSGSNLRGSDLSDSNLSGSRMSHYQIPQEGSLIVWKRLSGDIIAKLEISGRRTAAIVGRKCRADSALVLALERATEPWSICPTEAASLYLSSFIYRVGETVSEPSYSDDPRVECAPGIHFYLTKQEAIEHR